MLDWEVVKAGIWRAKHGKLKGVKELDSIKFDDLIGIDRQKGEGRCIIECGKSFCHLNLKTHMRNS